MSVRRQCTLVGLSRSSWYYECAMASADNLRLMRQIDEEYLRHPFKGRAKTTSRSGSVKLADEPKSLTNVILFAGWPAVLDIIGLNESEIDEDQFLNQEGGLVC